MALAIPHPAEPIETDAQRRDRLVMEMRLLAKAEAEARRDGTVPSATVNAWIDSFGTDTPLPMPQAR